MRQRLTRDGLAEKIPFVAVFEETKAGWPHLHILCRAPYIPQNYLSGLAAKYLRSPVVDIRKVYNRRHASRYVAKYIAKGPAKFNACKRYWRSQDYCESAAADKPIHDSNQPAWREREHIDYLQWTLQKCDWHHRKTEGDTVILEPGSEARWLWAEHDPPTNCGEYRCIHTT